MKTKKYLNGLIALAVLAQSIPLLPAAPASAAVSVQTMRTRIFTYDFGDFSARYDTRTGLWFDEAGTLISAATEKTQTAAYQGSKVTVDTESCKVYDEAGNELPALSKCAADYLGGGANWVTYAPQYYDKAQQTYLDVPVPDSFPLTYRFMEDDDSFACALYFGDAFYCTLAYCDPSFTGEKAGIRGSSAQADTLPFTDSGDTTADGEINVLDAVLSCRIVVEEEKAPVSDLGLELADVDGDGLITTGDTTALIHDLAHPGEITPEPQIPDNAVPVLSQKKTEPQPYDAGEMEALCRALSERYTYEEEIDMDRFYDDYLYLAEYDGEDNIGYTLTRGEETDQLSLFFFYENAQYAFHMEIRALDIDETGKLTVYAEKDTLSCPGTENYGIFRRDLTVASGWMPEITDIELITDAVADFSDIPQQLYITVDTFGEAEPDFYIMTGSCKWEGRLYQQFRHFELMPDGRYHVERALWDHTEDGFRYGDLFVPDGKVSMTRIYPEPDDPVCAEVYFDCLASDAKLHRIGSCINVMEQKKLTVTDIDYDGSQHWSISLKDENGGEYYYGLSEYGTNGGNLLGINVLDSAVGYGYTFAMYQGIPVIPLELVYTPADKIPVLSQNRCALQWDYQPEDKITEAMQAFGYDGYPEDFFYAYAMEPGDAPQYAYSLKEGTDEDILTLYFNYWDGTMYPNLEIMDAEIDLGGVLHVTVGRYMNNDVSMQSCFVRELHIAHGSLPQITGLQVDDKVYQETYTDAAELYYLMQQENGFYTPIMPAEDIYVNYWDFDMYEGLAVRCKDDAEALPTVAEFMQQRLSSGVGEAPVPFRSDLPAESIRLIPNSNLSEEKIAEILADDRYEVLGLLRAHYQKKAYLAENWDHCLMIVPAEGCTLDAAMLDTDEYGHITNTNGFWTTEASPEEAITICGKLTALDSIEYAWPVGSYNANLSAEELQYFAVDAYEEKISEDDPMMFQRKAAWSAFQSALPQQLYITAAEHSDIPSNVFPVFSQKKTEPQPYDAGEMEALCRALSERYTYEEEIDMDRFYDDYLYLAEYDGEDNIGYTLTRGEETDQLSLFFFYENAQYAFHMEIRALDIDETGKLTVYAEKDTLSCPGTENYGIFRRDLTVASGWMPEITDIELITDAVADFSDIPQQLSITLK